MTFNILSVPSSKRIPALVDRLQAAGIRNYAIYKGRETPRRFDNLFQTIQQIVEEHRQDPYIILLEDDILFTQHFSLGKLKKIVEQGKALQADIILGGIKEGSRIQKASEDLLQVHNYRGSQLMLLYPSIYSLVLDTKVDQEFEILCSYHPSIRKFVTFPFLAYQMDGPSRFLPYTGHQKDYIDFEQQIPALT